MSACQHFSLSVFEQRPSSVLRHPAFEFAFAISEYQRFRFLVFQCLKNVRHPASVICHLSTVVCRLSFVIEPPRSALCGLIREQNWNSDSLL